MDHLPPLPIALPLLAAAALAAIGRLLPRRAVDSIALGTAAVTLALALLLVRATAAAPIIHWSGGWLPRGGVAVGVALAADPIGAGLAALAAALAVGALAFSWRYFEAAHHLYSVLMLLFLGAMEGFCLSGDLFNLFVFFELMTVSACALAGHRNEERGPIQGALNLGILNGVGGFLVLHGVALIYARTGALNLAQIGERLAAAPADALVAVAFALIAGGFLTKAAAMPFHFWLPDAHAAAPTPVCVLLSGVMVQLGLYAVFRVYWTAFSGPLSARAPSLSAILLALGEATAALGAALCFSQRHLKRLLAFSTLSHTGVALAGLALLSPAGLTGAAVYVLGHGLAKASLFVCAGIVLNRLGGLDEIALRGRGRCIPRAGVMLAAGGLALAGMPPFGTFEGKSIIDQAAVAAGRRDVFWVVLFSSAVTGAAVLRAGARIFLGWGPPAPRDRRAAAAAPDEAPEIEGAPLPRTPWPMLAPGAVFLALSLAVGLAPDLASAIHPHAVRFEDRHAYQAAVLGGPSPPLALAPPPHPAPAGAITGAAAAALAVALALLGLRPRAARAIDRALGPLRALHSGHPGDYVAWLAAGVAGLGALAAALLR